MADQIFEIKFHNLFGYKFGRIVDEAHNLYNGDEGWATKDELNAFMNKFLEALNKEHLRRVNIQKYKRCLDKADRCESEENRLEAVAPIFDSDKECWEYNSDYWFKWRNRWLELAEKFKQEE